MNWNDAREAFNEAQRTIRASDSVATDMARMLANRLHGVQSGDALADLKRELRGFDLRTLSWKKRA